MISANVVVTLQFVVIIPRNQCVKFAGNLFHNLSQLNYEVFYGKSINNR